jgi:hypothetical protein
LRLYRSSPKKVKVSPSLAKPAVSVINKPAVAHVRSPAVPKRESHTPFLGDQSFGGKEHRSRMDDHKVSQTVKSRDVYRLMESSDDEPTGKTHTFGYISEPLCINNLFTYDTVTLPRLHWVKRVADRIFGFLMLHLTWTMYQLRKKTLPDIPLTILGGVPVVTSRCYLGRLTQDIAMFTAILGLGSRDVGYNNIFGAF